MPTWNEIYSNKNDDQLSWHQSESSPSDVLLSSVDLNGKKLIDVGAGTSRFIDRMLGRGLKEATLIDLSEEALKRVGLRLAEVYSKPPVQMLTGDLLTVDIGDGFDIWHDRAVFHFLLSEEDRTKYKTRVLDALNDSGEVVIATFAEDGPEKCSGLPIRRHSIDELCAFFAPEFELVDSLRESHQTPAGRSQSFVFGRFKRI